jgi:peptide/nickel transport system substrate-binding protein
MDRFASYWGGRAAEASLLFQVVEAGSDRRQRLYDGAADVAASLPDDTAAVPPGVQLQTRPSVSVTHLGMRVDRPPLDDVRVRRAISLALDRNALVDVLAGRGRAAGQLVSPSVFGFDPRLRPPAGDVEGARRLLAEAHAAFPAPLALEHNGGTALVAAIRAQLARAGIPVETVARPWKDLYPRLVAKQATLYFAGESCSTGDASDVLDAALHSRDAARGYGESNFTGYASPQMDRIVEESAQTLNTARRRALLQEALDLAAQDVPLVPLWQRELVFGTRAGVTWQARQDGRPYGIDMRRVN